MGGRGSDTFLFDFSRLIFLLTMHGDYCTWAVMGLSLWAMVVLRIYLMCKLVKTCKQLVSPLELARYA